MKIARLPTGEMMEFPPDYPDDEIDRQVRQKMGIPEPPDESQMLMQLAEVLMQQQEQIAMAMQDLSTAMQQVVAAQQETAAVMAQKLDILSQVMTRPRVLIKDANGKPVGAKIDMNNVGV